MVEARKRAEAPKDPYIRSGGGKAEGAAERGAVAEGRSSYGQTLRSPSRQWAKKVNAVLVARLHLFLSRLGNRAKLLHHL